MTNPLSRVIRETVFHSPPRYSHINEMLAMFFHRSAATMYALYTLWSLSIIISTPWEDWSGQLPFQKILVIMLFGISLCCTIGATFFPRTGRLEMFAASSFIIIFPLYMVHMSVQQWPLLISPGLGATAFLSLAHLVVPLARITFIFRKLMVDAKWRKK